MKIIKYNWNQVILNVLNNNINTELNTMKPYYIYFIFCMSFSAYGDTCGLDTMQTQKEVITALECMDNAVKTAEDAINTHANLSSELREKLTSLRDTKILCRKFKVLYDNAKIMENKNIYFGIVKECNDLYEGRQVKFKNLVTDYNALDSESNELKELVTALRMKYQMLKINADMLIKNSGIQ